MSSITNSHLEQAIAVLELLETTTKRTPKEKLLQENKDNPALQSIIRMALGTDKFYVHEEPDLGLCSGKFSKRKAWTKFEALTKKLSSRKVTGGAARKRVLDFYSLCDPLMAKWVHRILEHDLRCGIGRRTIATVFGKQWVFSSDADSSSDGGYLHSWKFRQCSAAKPVEKLPKKYRNLSYPRAGEFKLDGERFLSVSWIADGEVQIVSRGNLHKPHLESFRPFADQVVGAAGLVGAGDGPIFLDGELLSSNWNKTSSVVSRTTNFDGKEFLKEVVAILFDWAPLSQYETGVFEMPWKQRKNQLMGSLCVEAPTEEVRPGLYKTKFPNILVLGHSILRNERELLDFYDLALSLKFEGVMTKELDGFAVYDEKRGPEMVKHKPEESLTGTIVKCASSKKGKNGPAEDSLVKKARRWLSNHGTLKDDGYYLKVEVSESKGTRLEQEFKVVMKDAVDDRVWFNSKKGELTYRYGARLKHFVVTLDGKTFHVGTGIGHKNGSDMRMRFWRKRKKLIGMKVDFKHQPDPVPVAVMRFNRFVRFREDL